MRPLSSLSRPPVQGTAAPDLLEIIMHVVQVLVDQGWAAQEIADDLRQAALVVDLMHKTSGVQQ